MFCFTSLGSLYLEGLIHGGAYFRNFTVPTVGYNKPWSLNQDPKTDHLSALRASLLPLCPTLVDKKIPSRNQGIFQTAICTEYYIRGNTSLQNYYISVVDQNSCTLYHYCMSIITLPHIYVLESEVLVHKMSSAS